VTFKKSQRVFCFLFSFVLPITFFWSAYNFFNRITLGIEPKTIYEVDSLALLGLVFCLLFFFGYAYYILSEVPFLQRGFFYMGWWSFLLIVKGLLVLIPIKTTQILLISFIYLLGLYLVSLTFINLRKLLGQNLANPGRSERVAS
jgi:hypothetical protein